MATPVIIVGATEKVGAAVIAALKPDYEVVQFVLAASVAEEVPRLLKGEVRDPSSSLGSGNWSSFPKAIWFGGAFTDDDITRLRRLVADTEGTKSIPWLRVDTTKPPFFGDPRYGQGIVARAKETLKKMKEEGKLDGKDDGIYMI